MTKDLIERLKTCPPEERQELAFKIAQNPSDQGIKEIIRMVEGEYRRRKKPDNQTKPSFLKKAFWKIFGEPSYLFETLEDQLIGIAALGETRSSLAREYLQRVYCAQAIVHTDYCFQEWVGQSVDSQQYRLEYRHTRMELRDQLDYSTFTDIYPLDSEEFQKYIERHIELSKAHQIIRAAIKKLAGEYPTKLPIPQHSSSERLI